MKLKYPFYPVVLAGGSGTRFWPRSRRRMAKQVLALDGEQTMIQQTVLRLLPLAPEDRFWVILMSTLSRPSADSSSAFRESSSSQSP